MCYGFLLQLKKVMGSTNLSLKIDGFSRTHQTHANATTDLVPFKGDASDFLILVSTHMSKFGERKII